MLGEGANEAANVALPTAELHRQIGSIKGDFGCGFGGPGADGIAFGWGWEVTNVGATFAQALEKSCNLLGLPFKGEVVAYQG